MASPRTRRSRPRFLAVLTTAFLLLGIVGAVADGGSEAPPAADPGGLGLSLGGLIGRALGASELLEPARLGRLRVPGDVRVLVVSSGADKATFGDGYDDRLARPGDTDG